MHTIRVGDCEYCEESGELRLGKEVEHLQPQVAKVFICLANHCDEVVTRNQLMDAAWHHQVISDECLTRCISVIRKILKRHDSQLSVQTLHKRGYRLVEDGSLVHADKTHTMGYSMVGMLLLSMLFVVLL